MEIQHQSNMRGSFELQQQTPSLPPSSSSSPSHEFSFTISFESSSLTPIHHDKAKPHHPSSAVDLTPADDIFFHGHLLPLHVLPMSPRSSTNSLDSFTLPIKELLANEGNDKPHNIEICVCSNCDKSKHHSFNSYEYRRNHDHDHHDHVKTNKRDGDGDELATKKRAKSKSFSLFGLQRRRKDEDSSDKEKKKVVKFDVGHFLKKYTRMFSKGRNEEIHLRKQPYSFSGKISSKEGRMINLRGRRREFSAPASIRTSPTNSGVIKTTNPHTSSSDSTMEELQAAIQAAISHCKNSIATA